MIPVLTRSLNEMAAPGKPLNLSNKIYEEIKNFIIELRLPPGAQLDERSLAEELNVSRTPVREALRRLAQEGWVIWPERRQAFVREITPADAAEIFMLRDMLEIYAINIIFDTKEPRFLAGQLVPLARSMKESATDRVAFIKADMAFHSQIISFTGNGRLCDLWQRICGEITRIGIYCIHGDRTVQKIYDEHEALIEAFWSEARERAIEELRMHHKMIVKAYQQKSESTIQPSSEA